MAEPRDAPPRSHEPILGRSLEERALARQESALPDPAEVAPKRRRWLPWLWVGGVIIAFLVSSINVDWTLGLKDASVNASFSTDWKIWLWIAAAIVPPVWFRLRARRGRSRGLAESSSGETP